MLNINYKKEAIKYLNKRFSNYNQMQEFCNRLGNNPGVIIQMISKVIKYVFVNPGCFYADINLTSFIEDLPFIDRIYMTFSAKHTAKVGFKKNKNELPYLIDDDIDPNDLIGLKLPELETINKICQDNTEINEISQGNARERAKKLNSLAGFSHAAFTYEVEELVPLNEDFIYDSEHLTGDVITDFRSLYSDERYKEGPSPLTRRYSDNLKGILSSNDITFIKKGSVYYIVNGRHRVLYLLAHGTPVYIRAVVLKRIENERFNDLLIMLLQKHNFKIIKNNPYSDDMSICLIYENMLYLINDLSTLEGFALNNNGPSLLMPFTSSTYDIENIRELIHKIMMYCASNEISILDISFTDLALRLNEHPGTLLYEAYLAVGFIRNRERLYNMQNNLDKSDLNR